ncbi:dTDP-4-dehydrorhamnose reductase [Bacteroides pyogenes]|uniref:dTDP-4-dehydrorhamnose reductase n=1 Tax=Bacteroides pyogenes TaxID=310300 RepID=UPI001BA7DE8A|nr:dTDP-4-dehydrorhamnose reductase [Bacteroides pyogenes]MBR8719416.1 dTDP-4-dehydrorhamnose reductase [Bacteroides pyogenes]MBR8786299.1 dTDP-4-dehydrorhamnose reductase [Bacteroides pyogenes]MBR8791782.1 dTDP-4-dehydrorhamnose reductase [Bacteroides pyogenes]MCF2708800.1 dTDP-4-dehydrorhamnose reductase [Bacteroides pyogenes]
MNILVTGANGQLGNEMRIIAKGSSDNYIFTDVSQVERLETTYLDITDIEAIRTIVSENNVNAIVNCAAWTNVDACENDEKLATLAEKLNADAPKNLAIAMKEVGGVLFHLSTDYVFGQEAYNTPCNPDQKGTPTGVYGATKKYGEENILASGCEYIILRTAWLYSEFGKNFCKTMLNLTATKSTLKVVFDQCGTPTYAYDLAAAIFDIISNRKFEGNTGIYHYSNEGVTSWYDFTQMIAKIAGHKDCDILPCYSSEYPSPVKRPSYSVFDKKTFKDTFGIRVPYWVDSLEVCINNIRKQQ